jgi:hypothetical protein
VRASTCRRHRYPGLFLSPFFISRQNAHKTVKQSVLDSDPAASVATAANAPESIGSTITPAQADAAAAAMLAAVTETSKARAIRQAIPAPAKHEHSPAADLTQVRLLVDGMNGQRCALAIENALRRTAGVQEVAVGPPARWRCSIILPSPSRRR